jgi:hypothetical protein
MKMLNFILKNTIFELQGPHIYKFMATFMLESIHFFNEID